jgi:hypothetical protein
LPWKMKVSVIYGGVVSKQNFEHNEK